MVVRSNAAVLDELAADVDRAYPHFVRIHAGTVYSAALRLSRSPADAEDLAQETFVRAYRALRRLGPDRVRTLQARAWLLTITLNLWRNHQRGVARRPRQVEQDRVLATADSAPGPDAVVEADEAARALASLLDALPERQRLSVVLRHVVGLSYLEIAAVLSCPVGTAKANVARGVTSLRQLLRESADHDHTGRGRRGHQQADAGRTGRGQPRPVRGRQRASRLLEAR
jgi:RNA polymerase sigma factor (sigma-70 family)